MPYSTTVLCYVKLALVLCMKMSLALDMLSLHVFRTRPMKLRENLQA